MAKDRVLDTGHKTITVIIMVLGMVSCSLPKIVVLHDPLTPEEHVNLGVSYESRGEFDAAVREYRAASRKLPIAYLYLGNVYFQQNDFDNAEICYRKAIKKTDDPRAYNNLAWLYYVTDADLEQGERLARKAVGLSPGSSHFRDTLDKIMEKRQKKR